MRAEIPIGRRGFLRLGGFAAGMIALSRLRLAAPLPCQAGEVQGAGSAGPELRSMSGEDGRILTAIAERMVYTGEPTMPRFSETGGLASIDAALAHLDADVAGQLHWALLLFEWGPPLFAVRASRFTGLAEDAQDDYLRDWAESRFAVRRLAFQAFKNLSYLGYYSQDATWKGIHYDGPWIPRPRMGAGI
jgi:hypothetical protein